MGSSLVLALDIDASASDLLEILSTTKGQSSFWTSDCEVSGDTARFSFQEAPVDLNMAVETTDDTVRFTVTSGFPFWDGSIIEYQLGDAMRSPSGTGVLFRHRNFGEGYGEADLAFTAQSWARILDRLQGFAETGTPQPLMS